jgi:hypothetical protein
MDANKTDKDAGLPSVFIGSSSEGLEIGRYLQQALEQTKLCTVTRWDQGVFQASSYTMESLTDAAQRADFAVLIATGDDTVSSRGESRAVVRDNVIFELGLFIGALGRTRTYIVADKTQPFDLPSDLHGLTWLPYSRRHDNNQRAAVNDAALGITERIRELGSRRPRGDRFAPQQASDQRRMLDIEIERICSAARAQGWRVKTNSDTTLRLQSRSGKRFTLPLGEPMSSREDIRRFAAQLRADGLRVSQSVRRPVADSPQAR